MRFIGTETEQWFMAESDMVIAGSAAAAGHGRGGMGMLRLFRRWPVDQVAAGGHADPWPDTGFQPVRTIPEPAAAGSPHLVIDRRATTMALRQTIDEWRAAERELEGLIVGSRDRARTQAAVELLRMRHHRLFIRLTLLEQPTEAD